MALILLCRQLANQKTDELFQKALKEGEVETCRLRIVVLGRAAVGKSSIVRALLGEEFIEEYNITDSADVKIAFAKMNKKGEWIFDEGNDQFYEEEEYAAISRSIRSGVSSKRKRSRNIGNPSQSQKVTNLLQDKGQGFTSRSETKEALIPDYECKRVEDLLEQEEEETNPVYIWDFGGQAPAIAITASSDSDTGPGLPLALPADASHSMEVAIPAPAEEVYYSVHQLFLTSDTIYLLLSDLSHDLDDLVKQDLTRSMLDKGTERDYLDYFMSTVKLITCSKIDKENPNSNYSGVQPPHLFTVGTKRDLIEDKTIEKGRVEEIQRHVESSELGKVARGKVIPFSSKETETIDTLKDRIKDYVQDFKRTLPVKWFRFRNKLQKEPVRTWDEVLEIANDGLHFSDEAEVKAALTYFHNQRELVYFEEMPFYIICQPMWLVKRIREVITTEEYLDQNARKFDKLGPEFRSLKHNAKLYDKLAAAIWGNKKQSMIEIMQKYLLIMPWKDEETEKKCYIIPSLCSRMVGCECQTLVKSIPPLYFKPKRDLIPVGMTSRLITFLVLEKDWDYVGDIFCDGATIYREGEDKESAKFMVCLQETKVLKKAVLKVFITVDESPQDLHKAAEAPEFICKFLHSTKGDIEEGIEKINEMINIENEYEAVFVCDCNQAYKRENQLEKSVLRCKKCRECFPVECCRYWIKKFHPGNGTTSADPSVQSEVAAEEEVPDSEKAQAAEGVISESSSTEDINVTINKYGPIFIKAFKKKLPQVSNNIDYDEIKDFMKSWDILTEKQRQNIQEAMLTSSNKIGKIEEYLEKRTNEEKVLFAKALIETDQKHWLKAILSNDDDTMKAINNIDLEACRELRQHNK